MLILHHYDSSPYSEKVRKLLAHKRVPWRAVEQPTIMPKPDLVPLTGGYRRIPVLLPAASAWCARVDAMGDGDRSAMTPADFPRIGFRVDAGA